MSIANMSSPLAGFYGIAGDDTQDKSTNKYIEDKVAAQSHGTYTTSDGEQRESSYFPRSDLSPTRQNMYDVAEKMTKYGYTFAEALEILQGDKYDYYASQGGRAKKSKGGSGEIPWLLLAGGAALFLFMR